MPVQAHSDTPELLFPNARLLIFAKAPVLGQVKTRLIPGLGAEGAVRLYTRLLRRTVSELGGAGLCPVQCWCAPDASHEIFREFRLGYGVKLLTQRGADLGARMCHAAASALGESDAIVLIGADCPGLEADYVRHALVCLKQGADAVVGPAEDGGYVLLGLKRVAVELFKDMPWGTDGILAETRQRLQRLAWDWRELPILWDVDEPQDLRRLTAFSDLGEWGGPARR